MKSSKARIGGLFYVGLCCCVLACNSRSGTEITQLPAAYQYPTDTVWRGLGLSTDNPLLAEAQFPRYVDTLLLRYEGFNSIHYAYGVEKAEIDDRLGTIAQNQQARRYMLNKLGIPLSRTEAEKITYLNLSNKDLSGIPSELGILKNLRDLLLANNDIRSFNLALLNCRNLRRLDLSSNTISQLPSQLPYFLNLEDLSLRDNRLNSLPPNFSQLRKLRYLDLSNMHSKFAKGHNNFSQIPAVVCHLPVLEKLLLEKLDISLLPVSIIYLKNLKVLSISGCRNINLNNAFRILAQMPNLAVLDISFVGRVRLPNEIGMLRQLKVLIWQEESGINADEIKRLQNLLPDTKIYHSGGHEPIPFLRGNSIETLLRAGK